MLAFSQMKRNMAFELKILLNEPLESCKVLCKFLKISNSNRNNGIKIREQIEKWPYKITLCYLAFILPRLLPYFQGHSNLYHVQNHLRMNCGVNIQLWFVQSDMNRVYQMNINVCFLQTCWCQDKWARNHIFSPVEHLAWHKNIQSCLEKKKLKCALSSKGMISAVSKRIKSQLWVENKGQSNQQQRLGWKPGESSEDLWCWEKGEGGKEESGEEGEGRRLKGKED